MAKRLKNLTRRRLWQALALVLVLAVLGLSWHHWHKSSPTTTPGGSLSPATAAEKQAASDRKDQIVQEQKNQASSGAGIKNVSVIITEASSTTVKGYVQGVFEDGGTCTATATQGSQSQSKTSTGFANVSYTQCAPISWSPALGSGNWTINLAYKSATAQGNITKTVEVK